MKGYVYVMGNESMPGIWKVGRTEKRPEERAYGLYTTGVPTPFTVEYCVYVKNYWHVEAEAHRRLSDYHHGKEFFKCPLATCVAAVKGAASSYLPYHEKYREAGTRTKAERTFEDWKRELKAEEEKKARAAKAAEEEKVAAIRRESARIARRDDRINSIVAPIALVASFPLTWLLFRAKWERVDYVSLFGCWFLLFGFVAWVLTLVLRLFIHDDYSKR